jgi:hypothetical protein
MMSGISTTTPTSVLVGKNERTGFTPREGLFEGLFETLAEADVGTLERGEEIWVKLKPYRPQLNGWLQAKVDGLSSVGGINTVMVRFTGEVVKGCVRIPQGASSSLARVTDRTRLEEILRNYPQATWID